MSIPVGYIIIPILIIFAGGIAAGWSAANRRRNRRSKVEGSADLAQASHFLDALPQAAVIVGKDGTIQASNSQAAELLAGFGILPLTINVAIQRVINSQIAEVLEVAAPGDDPARLQMSISPLQAENSHSGIALLLFSEPRSGTGRTQVYKRLMDLLAHELRTPLTAIMGHVEILSSCRIDEETLWKRSLGFVSSEVDRLAKLVEDLLSLSRLDHIPIHIQVINLRLAAEQAFSDLYDQAKQNDVTLVLQAPSELPRVQADSDRMRQVFLNLVHNAIKYAPGSVVTIQLVHANSQLQVEVRDTGPGVDPQDLPHIFEPLYRSRSNSSGIEGSGLGLAIVRLILDQHNSTISVHSASAQGLIFRFSLPLASVETQPHKM